MKNWLALGLAFCTALSHAHTVTKPCDFARQDGMAFRILPTSPEERFKTREKGDIQPHWVSDRFNPVPIDTHIFEYRRGKLQTEKFWRRMEPSLVPGEESGFVRYYQAVTDNCDTIWARIDERHPYFERHLDPNDHQQDPDVPWERVSEHLHIQLTTELFKLHAWIGNDVTIIPHTTGERLVGKTISQDEFVALDDFERVKLKDVGPDGHVQNGRLLSSIELTVERNDGQTVLIPWISERMTRDNPLEDDNIRRQYQQDIKNGNIRFGMNIHEVHLAYGEPDTVRWLPRHVSTQTQAEWIKDDEFPYAGKFTLVRHNNIPEKSKRDGQFQEWRYPHRLREGDVLVFDDKDELHEVNQTIHVRRNEAYQPIALPPLRDL